MRITPARYHAVQPRKCFCDVEKYYRAHMRTFLRDTLLFFSRVAEGITVILMCRDAIKGRACACGDFEITLVPRYRENKIAYTVP